MKLAKPIEFKNEKPEKVIEHLKSVKRETIKANPLSLCLKTGTGTDAEKIFLMVSNGNTKYYEVRESFLMKLLKWYSFPTHVIPRLSTETIVSAANDFLLNIKSGEVFVKLENNEAITITSNRYTDIPDLEILELCKSLGIKKVSRNDFFMSLYSEEKLKIQPYPGDDCGFGFNIFNSETGFGALRISHYILRYVCSNGATVGIKKGEWKPLIHYNISKKDALEYIISSLKEIENTQENVSQKLMTLKNQDSTDSIETVKRKVAGILGYQESLRLINEYNNNTESLLTDFDGTQYSLFNFITSKAQGYDIFRRTQLEHLAGNIFLS